MEVFFVVFHTSSLVWVGDFMLRKEPRNTEAPHINIQSPKKTSQHITFSHKKKYCGIKDIRVLFYSSIFQMIFVFPFIVLKYFSFCCHSSHSILFRNPLFYCSFVLFVKSDSKFNQNSSCQLSILFNLFVTHLCLQPVFLNLTFLISGSYFFYAFCLFCYSVSFIILSLCHSVSSLSFCLFSSFCRTSSLLFSFSFWPHFYPFIWLFFNIFA